MTARITCKVRDANPSNPNDWNLELAFKIEGENMNVKEKTIVVWLGALFNNIGDEEFQALVKKYVDLHWDEVVSTIGYGDVLHRPKGKIL